MRGKAATAIVGGLLAACFAASGSAQQTCFTFSGDSIEEQFGHSVSGAGDVNGDGYGDLIVGARWDDNNGYNSGSARVYSGKDGAMVATFHGDQADDELGWSVSGAGDVDNNGFDDVIAGAPGYEGSGAPPGYARVFSLLEKLPQYGTGCAGGGVVTPALSVSGFPTPGGYLALSVSAANPSSLGLLFGGLTEVAIPAGCGCTLDVAPVLLQILFNLDGKGSYKLGQPLPAVAPLGTVKLQAFVADGATVCGFSGTNGVSLTIQ